MYTVTSKLITATSTGTKISDRWVSKKPAAGATARGTDPQRKASRSNTMPTEGPGMGKCKKCESASPIDRMSSSTASPCNS